MKHKVPIIILCGMWHHAIITPYPQYGLHKWKSYLINEGSKISKVKIIQEICAKKFTYKMHMLP